MKKQISQITRDELISASEAAENRASQLPDINSNKYLNKISISELYDFFVPFGIDDPTQVKIQRDENNDITNIKFVCDDFDAILFSDYNFSFAFFDSLVGDRNSLGKTIRYYEIAELSKMLNLSRDQTMSLLLTGLFINRFPDYAKNWRQLFESGQIPAFSQSSVPNAFKNFNNLQTLFELTKIIKQQQADLIGKELA